ncbi:CHAT domain-containing protein [Asticcacaulis sp. YBE204]|uniref:CHAT domain-containing protein n=1 Tax=Asticcacaulis sp. YBE204 TaxID=1282363 RepID=UPI00138AB7E3|nr:CHAT domain-containing tetratricopeptide repeat protein [Asticcacaulis sp. YBE204]
MSRRFIIRLAVTVSAMAALGAMTAETLAAPAAKPVAEAKPKPADVPPRVLALRERINTTFNGEPPADPKKLLVEASALMKEAEAEPLLGAEHFTKASIYYALALFYNQDAKGAVEVVVRARKIYEASGLGETQLYANTLQNEAVYLNGAGRTEESLVTQQRAYEVMSKVSGPDSPEVGAILASMAVAYGRLGRLSESIAAYERGLPLMTPENSSPSSLSAQYGNYADRLETVGQYEKAVEMNRKALDIAVKYSTEEERALRWAYSRLSERMLPFKRYEAAEIYARKALDLAIKYSGKISPDTGIFTYRLARVYTQSGRLAEGEALMLEALEIIKQKPSVDAPDVLGIAWLELARYASWRNDLDLAETRARAGLAAVEPLGARGLVTRNGLHVLMGSLLLKHGRYAEALAEVQPTLDYYRTQLPPHARARINAESLEALILARLGRTAEAYEKAAALDAVLRGRLQDFALTGEERAENADFYGLAYIRFADIALSAGKPEEAFAAAQMAAFSEVASTAQSLAAQAALKDVAAADAALKLQRGQVRKQRLDRQRAYAQARASQSKAAQAESERVLADIAAVDKELRVLHGELMAAFPAYDAMRLPHPVRLSEARAALKPGQAVLLPFQVDDRMISMVLTPKGLNWSATTMAEAQAGQYIGRVRSSIDAGLLDPNAAFDRTAAYALGRAVLPPDLRQQMSGTKEIAVIGSGKIMTLPFSLLVLDPPKGRDDDPAALRGTAFLIKRYAVSVRPVFAVADRAMDVVGTGFAGIGAPLLGPSGDLLADLRGSPYALPGEIENRGGGDDDYRGNLADIKVLKTLPSLPFAAEELNRMAAILKADKTLLLVGKDATEAKVKAARLSDYSVVAFATHGLIGGETGRVGEPALVLTPPDVASEADDGLLTATEVSLLRLNAEWVILSACNTGSARETGAAGYSGLAQAFMQAGARNLLVSLWPVRDDAAARLSVGTLKANAAGLSKPDALRKATLDLLKDRKVPPHPALWAPFSLISR